MLKIKKTIVSEIDGAEFDEFMSLKDSMTEEEQNQKFLEMSKMKYKIDVAGTIKDNVKKAWDVVTDEDNFYKVTAIGFIGAMLFICGDNHRTNVKIRKKI